MTELRWALLLVGLLLIAGLVAWEKRGKGGRRGPDQESVSGSESERSPGAIASMLRSPSRAASQSPAARREEPGFSMPGLSRREPVRDLPIVEIDARSGSGPGIGDLPVFDMDSGLDQPATGGSWSQPPRPAAPHALQVDADLPRTEDPDVPVPQSAAAELDPVERASAWLADSVPNELPQTPVLAWPPEEQRKIVALRVVPRAGERFNGAALRRALVGEGFIHGELAIYHKPIGDGRVLLSAASLTRPGTFDPKTIDTQVFSGLNLFAVLPGPLPAREAVERLGLVARTLSQRLRGETQDERGQPLTDARLAELRREAADPVG